MVYESNTFRLFHELTEAGKAVYERLLEAKADEILFRHSHPFRFLARKVVEWIGLDVDWNDSGKYSQGDI